MKPDQTNSKLNLLGNTYGQPWANLLDIHLWERWPLNDLIVWVQVVVKRA